MDRKSQFRNVSFGGAWSERIADDEAVASSLEILERAVVETAERDLRGDFKVEAALNLVACQHPKGEMLNRAWGRALSAPNAGIRSMELRRIVVTLKAAIKTVNNG